MITIDKNTPVVYEKLSGWIKANLLQETVQTHSSVFKEAGTMRFLKANENNDDIFPEYIVDVAIMSKSIVVNYYPYNDENTIPKAGWDPHTRNDMDDVFRRAAADVLNESKGEISQFSFDLLNMKRIVVENFNGYTYPYSDKGKWMIFILERFEDGKFVTSFPKMYAIEKRDTAEMQTIFPMFPLASRTLFKVQGAATAFGKYLSYLLLKSVSMSKFVNFAPNLTQVELPMSYQESIPSYLKVDELSKYLKDKQVDKIVKTKNGVEDRSDQAPSEKDVRDSLLERMTRNFIDKEEILLSDVLQYGVSETLRAFNATSRKPIVVSQDIPGLAKKMCLMEGCFYAIPNADAESQELLLTEFDNHVIVCTKEAFPRTDGKFSNSQSSNDFLN